MEIIDLGSAVRILNSDVFGDTAGRRSQMHRRTGLRFYSRKDIDDHRSCERRRRQRPRYTGMDFGRDQRTVAKSVKPDEAAEIARITGAREGDLVCIVADKEPAVCKGLGALRLEFRDRLKLADPNTMAFGWIVDFPDVRMGRR